MMMILNPLTTSMMLLAQCWKDWIVIWKTIQYEKSANVYTVHDLSMY